MDTHMDNLFYTLSTRQSPHRPIFSARFLLNYLEISKSKYSIPK